MPKQALKWFRACFAAVVVVALALGWWLSSRTWLVLAAVTAGFALFSEAARVVFARHNHRVLPEDSWRDTVGNRGADRRVNGRRSRSRSPGFRNRV